MASSKKISKRSKAADPWRKLEHAYGPATDLPALLDAVVSPKRDVRAQAVLDLEARLAHQGTVYSATGAALPRLFEGLRDESTKERRAITAQIAELVALIAWGRGDAAAEASVKDGLRVGLPRLLSLLDHPDVRVRLAIARTLATLVNDDPKVPLAIALRLAKEDDFSARLALALAPSIRKCEDVVWLDACEALLDSTELETRLAGACALANVRREKAPERAVLPFLDALSGPPSFEAIEAGWSKMPFCGSGALVDLANLASFLGDARIPKVLPALVSAMSRPSPHVPALAEAMLYMAFKKGGAPKTASELEDVRRDALKVLVHLDAAWTARTDEVLRLGGLPPSRRGLAQFLGESLALGLVLDRELAIGGSAKAPLHLHAEALFSKGENAHALVAAIGAQLSAPEVLELLMELEADTYELDSRYDEGGPDVFRQWPELLRSLAARDPHGVTSWATRFLERELVAPVPSEERLRAFRFDALAAATEGPLDARFDPVVPANQLRPWHARIPAARLEGLVIADLRRCAMALGEPKGAHWGIGFAQLANPRVAFLDPCPTERLARALLGLAGLSGIGGDVVKSVAEHAREHARQHPELARAVAEFREREASVKSYLAMREALRGFVDEVYPPLRASSKTASKKAPPKRITPKKPAKKAATAKKGASPKKAASKEGPAKKSKRS